MSKRSTPPRPWQPMTRATRVLPEATQLAMARDPRVADAIESLGAKGEMWRNDRYVAHVYRREDGEDAGSVLVISVRRDDHGHVHDWRHMQAIKNDIAGPEAEAVELYPAESRLLDTSNQFWLWCYPPGLRIPIGYEIKRTVQAEAHNDDFPDSLQRPL